MAPCRPLSLMTNMATGRPDRITATLTMDGLISRFADVLVDGAHVIKLGQFVYLVDSSFVDCEDVKNTRMTPTCNS